MVREPWAMVDPGTVAGLGRETGLRSACWSVMVPVLWSHAFTEAVTMLDISLSPLSVSHAHSHAQLAALQR